MIIIKHVLQPLRLVPRELCDCTRRRCNFIFLAHRFESGFELGLVSVASRRGRRRKIKLLRVDARFDDETTLRVDRLRAFYVVF